MVGKFRTLVTGSAGFVGYHLSKRLLEEGNEVVGIDNLEEGMGSAIEQDRNSKLCDLDGYTHSYCDIRDVEDVKDVIKTEGPFDKIYHLAALPGVKGSIIDPKKYIETNVIGFQNVLSAASKGNIRDIVFASSSSVYSGNKKLPNSIQDALSSPSSIYALTKMMSEHMASIWCEFNNMNIISLRFFSIYGPFGRPDMAPWIFTRQILDDIEIKLSNFGTNVRDLNYIDDVIDKIMTFHQSYGGDGFFRIFNIGSGRPISSNELITIIEKHTGKTAKIAYKEAKKWDAFATKADVSEFPMDVEKPKVFIEEGMKRFIDWFKSYHGYND